MWLVAGPLKIAPITQETAATGARGIAQMHRNAVATSERDYSFAAKAKRERGTVLARQHDAEAALILVAFVAAMSVVRSFGSFDDGKK